MIRYYLCLEALSPLSITGHQNLVGQAGTTLTYIPGTTLRGALAWRLLRSRPAATHDPVFAQLFATAGLRCGPLYPLGTPNDPWASISLPLPRTARSCKRRPGFRSDPDHQKAADQHGVVDTLVAALEEKALQRWQTDEAPPAALRGLGRHEICPQDGCGEALERFPGYYQVGQDQGNVWHRATRPARTLQTRTALLEQLGTAKPEALFSRETLAAGQQFAGFLDVPDNLAGEVAQLLAVGSEIQVGAGRTAGLGRLMVQTCRLETGELSGLLGSVADRLAAFAGSLPPDLLARWALAPLTLWSDAILLDARLRFASAPEPDVLRSYLALEARANPGSPPPGLPTGLELFLGVARSIRLAAWHSGSVEPQTGEAISKGGRPRSTDLGIAAGSTFVLAAPPEEAGALWALVAWLEEHGLGERRAEGYGQLLVAHPFHTEVAPL